MPKIPKDDVDPYWSTTDGEFVRLYLGNVTDVLRGLPEKSVHCVVTSPPYWGLRDYKAGTGEIGREKTPQEFIERIVEVFREVRRVLRDEGTCWLNLGDTYGPRGLVGVPWRVALALQADGWILRQDIIWHKPSPMPESVKNRCTKAHEYVFLLTKSNRYFYDTEAIKEQSVSSSFEFNGSTTEKSGANGDRQDGGPAAVGERAQNKNKRSVWTVSSQGYPGAHFATFPPKLIQPMILAGLSERGCCTGCGSPWHRIVQEKKLVRSRPNDYVKRTGEEGTGNSAPNSAAGVDTKTLGWYPTCTCDGLPPPPPPPATGKGFVTNDTGNSDHFRDKDDDETRLAGETDNPKYEAWVERAKEICELSEGIETDPCVVLDPFIGSGTTCVVSLSLGRGSVGIDLSEKYLRNNAIPRIEGALLSRPKYRSLLPRESKNVEVGRKAKTTDL